MGTMFDWTLATSTNQTHPPNNWFAGAQTAKGQATQPQNQADAVLVNLGTNDFWLQHEPTQAQWNAAWINLASTVAHFYGATTPVLAICGPWWVLNGAECNATRFAVQACHEKGLSAVQYVDAIDPAVHPMSIAGNSSGCVGHPSAEAHAAMASALEPIVSKALGWQTIPQEKKDQAGLTRLSSTR